MIAIQLYNKMKNRPGYLNEKGELINNDAWNNYWVTTDYMQVTPGSSCTYSGITFAYNKMYACYYDIDQQFVSSFIPNTEKTDIIIPEDVYYVRFSLAQKTRINLCSTPLEVGSISEISGSPEAATDFIRTKNYIQANNYMTAILAPDTTYTVSISPTMKQLGLYFYRETLSKDTIYDSYYESTLGEDIESLTFTTIKDTRFIGLKVRAYNPDRLPLEDIKMMINLGNEPLDYITYSEVDNNDAETFSFTIIAEAYQSFRDELYQYVKSTLSANLTKGDLDTIIRLMCYIFGDLSGMVYRLKDQIDPDKAEIAYLRHLGSVIGYEWNEGLTPEQQREAIKVYLELQKKRGTNFSLKNLIAVFGQDRASYYSSSDMRGITITEGGKDGEPIGTVDENGLYPGDIMIEIPAFSTILVDAIDKIRLIGTRIIFTFAVYATIDCRISVDNWKEIYHFFDPEYHYGNDYNPTIAQWIKEINQAYSDGKIDGIRLQHISDWPILQGRVKNCHTEVTSAVYQAEANKIPSGFIWNEIGLPHPYHALLINDEELVNEEVMYGYNKDHYYQNRDED